MNESLLWVLAWMAGCVIGVFFFGGLWWTIRKGVVSPRPATWFFGSMLVRTSAAVAGFYFISQGHWERLLLCLVGFVMARMLVTRWTRTTRENPTSTTKELRYAPQSR
jgi:F1F0 ATPase subunit 2